jgi:hypothetical protein
MSATEHDLISEYDNSLNDIITKFLSISHEIKSFFQEVITNHFAVDEGESSLLRWLWTDDLSFDQAFLKFKNLMKIRYEKYTREYDYAFLELDRFAVTLDQFLHKVPNSKQDKLKCAKEDKVYFVNDLDEQMEYSLDDLRYKVVVLQKTIIPAVKQMHIDVTSGSAKEIEKS